jgi:purine-binding chemotaxis protein CheW
MGQMVVFRLASQFFAIPISDIQEILPYEEVTPVPYAPRFVQGIVDIREQITPIIDLKLKFKLKGDLDASDGRIVVVTVDEQKLGILVDDVTEVVPIPDGDIRKPPKILTHKVLSGIVKLNGRLIIILEPRYILDETELDLLQTLTEETGSTKAQC